MTYRFQQFVALIALFFVIFQPFKVKAEGTDATLLSEVETIAPKRPFWLLLKPGLNEGDILLGQNPGQANMPTAFNWTLPEGFRVTNTLWSLPQRETLANGKKVWGTRNTEGILFEITPPSDLTEALTIGLEAYFQICNVQCETVQKSFSLTLPRGKGLIENKSSVDFKAARVLAPGPLRYPVEINLTSTHFEMKIFRGAEKPEIRTIDFYPQVSGIIDIDSPLKLKVNEDHWLVSGPRHLDPHKFGAYFQNIKGILITANSGAGGYSFYQIDVNNTVPMPDDVVWDDANQVQSLNLWVALGFAFVGGMILNLMPCVFPILTLKAFSLVKAGGQSAAHLRQDGISYGLGVLTTFLLVGGVLSALQSMGMQVGWGFQLQSPAFIFALAIIMTLVAMNLLGVYELSAPTFITDRLDENDEGAMGAFGTGVLATVLATPCTAPFMGASLGFALTQPPLTALSIFLALGLGMATPYVALSFSPKLAAKMPKPGPWLSKVKLWLSLPVLMTVAWLVWVFGTQTSGSGGMALIVLALFLLPLSFLLWKKGKSGSKVFRAVSLIGILSLTHFLYLSSGETLKRQAQVGALKPLGPGVETVAYSPSKLMSYQKQGRAVFVNFTASWCLTCIVHERLVFDKRSFQAFLRDNRIVYMVADWTNPNPDIAAILARYKRQGIPFYLFYPPGNARSAIVLPDVLTVDAALSALRGAL